MHTHMQTSFYFQYDEYDINYYGHSSEKNVFNGVICSKENSNATKVSHFRMHID